MRQNNVANARDLSGKNLLDEGETLKLQLPKFKVPPLAKSEIPHEMLLCQDRTSDLEKKDEPRKLGQPAVVDPKLSPEINLRLAMYRKQVIEGEIAINETVLYAVSRHINKKDGGLHGTVEDNFKGMNTQLDDLEAKLGKLDSAKLKAIAKVFEPYIAEIKLNGGTPITDDATLDKLSKELSGATGIPVDQLDFKKCKFPPVDERFLRLTRANIQCAHYYQASADFEFKAFVTMGYFGKEGAGEFKRSTDVPEEYRDRVQKWVDKLAANPEAMKDACAKRDQVFKTVTEESGYQASGWDLIPFVGFRHITFGKPFGATVNEQFDQDVKAATPALETHQKLLEHSRKFWAGQEAVMKYISTEQDLGNGQKIARGFLIANPKATGFYVPEVGEALKSANPTRLATKESVINELVTVFKMDPTAAKQQVELVGFQAWKSMQPPGR